MCFLVCNSLSFPFKWFLEVSNATSHMCLLVLFLKIFCKMVQCVFTVFLGLLIGFLMI